MNEDFTKNSDKENQIEVIQNGEQLAEDTLEQIQGGATMDANCNCNNGNCTGNCSGNSSDDDDEEDGGILIY